MVSRVYENACRKLGDRWVEYIVKAFVLVCVFALVGKCAPSMPPLCLAIVWAALSIAAGIGVAYHYVVSKARNRAGLEEGGIAARLNSGRVLSLVVAFALSAACIGGLVVELPSWGIAEWAMLVLAFPVYVGVFKLLERRLRKEFKPLLLTSRTVLASGAVLCALLLVAYVALCLAAPTPHYESMTEAFMGTSQPFANSSSTLLQDAGYVIALVNGLTAFALTKAVENSLAAYIAWRGVLCASTVIGLSGLIGTCSLKNAELKGVFLSLEAIDDEHAQLPALKRYIATACVLPIVLVVGCIALDAKVSEAAETEGYTMVRAAIRDQVGMTACVIDGKRYDYEKVKELCDDAREKSIALASEREAALVPLINEAFDRRLENVDKYLDWYYSLPADYDRLLQFFAGTVEQGMKEQLAAQIDEGVDESKLDETLDYYWEQSLQLEASIEERLARYELSDYGLGELPEWLVVPVKTLDSDFLSEPLAPTQTFLEAGERMGLSAAAGIVAGVIAKKATQKILAKPFFRKVVASLLEKLSARGLLAAGGTAIAPGVGTAIGVGVGFAGDYLFLKVDEAMNRESYRQEIVSALEESRAEMLEMCQGA